MPSAGRIPKQFPNFDLPVSYRIAEGRKRLRDARNVISYQGRLDTRNGASRFRAGAFPAGVTSISHYKKDDGTTHRIVKAGSIMYTVDQAGVETQIKAGLTVTARHRGLTFNGRHIIAVEGDGFFQFDGTTFATLGQEAPANVESINPLSDWGTGTFPAGNEYAVRVTYYSTITGFESNPSEDLSTAFPTYTTGGGGSGLRFRFFSTDNWAPENAFIDRVRIYLKDVTAGGAYLFWGESPFPPFGTFDYFSSADPPTSTQTPPDTNGPPPGTEAKYMAIYGDKLGVVVGEFPSEVVFSESGNADAFDDDLDALVLNFPLNGPLTAIAVGAYNGDSTSPYFVAFKRKSTHLYTEAGAAPVQVILSDVIGCVSQDTVFVKNGDIYFLSEVGWRVISQGKLVTEKETKNPATLGGGDIDDIFVQDGFEYEVNRTLLDKTFSVYYEALDQYMTWVSEGVSTSFSKTYVYEGKTGGFKPFEFAIPATFACASEDNRGRDCILFGDANGYLYQYSIKEPRSDRDAANAVVPIDAWAQIYWVPFDGDYDASYNFRELIVRAMTNQNEITVKTWLNFNLNAQIDYAYNFQNPDGSFILDVSVLDVDLLGDSRGFVTARNDINRVGESILVEFSQEIAGANLGIISAQLDFSKNGNRNAS